MAFDESTLKCPYTGAPIEILQIGGGTGYLGRVTTPEGGYTTRAFQVRAELIDFLRLRGGKLKGERLYPKIEVRDRPRRPVIGDLDGKERQAERDQDEAAQVAAERAVRDVVDGKRTNPA